MYNRHLFLLDLITLPLAAYLAFALHLGTFHLGESWATMVLLAATSLVLAPPILIWSGLYKPFWRYAADSEVLLVIRSVAFAVLAVSLVTLIIGVVSVAGAEPIPGAILVIFSLLVFVGTGTPRYLTKFAASRRASRPTKQARRTLVIGAGNAGMLTVQELARYPHLNLQVTGFIDDDPLKKRRRILDVPVLGTRHDIQQVVRDYRIEHIIIAMPTAPGKVIKEVVSSCDDVDIKPQIVPGIYQLLDGQVRVNQLREVEIDDLLRREPLQTDLTAVSDLLQGKRVLITGAGGSIGSELCRQIVRFNPAQLILLGHGENSIFTIHSELQNQLRMMADTRESIDTTLKPVIADFRFSDRIMSVFQEFQPEIVFHAGAHKHVPLMEENPGEAMTNNVFGTQNLLDAARAVGTERFVFVSTDKAVNPTSILGASKRTAELLVHQAAVETNRAYMIVRFGNVLGSRGSVVLTMKQQIANGGPVTVTHPDMTRYFMTIPEAVQLILQAAVLGRSGELFMFDMGDPVRIVDLAHDLVRLSGLELDEDIDVVYIGTRPGEKLYEELFLPAEQYGLTSHEKIFIAKGFGHPDPVELLYVVSELRTAAANDDQQAVRQILQRLIPEYQPEASGQPAPSNLSSRSTTEVQHSDVGSGIDE